MTFTRGPFAAVYYTWKGFTGLPLQDPPTMPLVYNRFVQAAVHKVRPWNAVGLCWEHLFTVNGPEWGWSEVPLLLVRGPIVCHCCVREWKECSWPRLCFPDGLQMNREWQTLVVAYCGVDILPLARTLHTIQLTPCLTSQLTLPP